MTARPFRFVQASDFLLHEPARGLAEIPKHLIEPLVEAPYRAAERVFDLALSEEVDFLLLVGNLVEPRLAGPRGLSFLHRQFARLAERHIAVYWAPTSLDGRNVWPLELAWPANVRLFPEQQVERFEHIVEGQVVCHIAGCGLDGAVDPQATSGVMLSDFAPPHELSPAPTIAVVPDQLETRAIAETAVNYWALGGRMSGSTPLSLSVPPRVAHYSGSPQGRSPQDIGPHGCTLVHVDERGVARVSQRPTDVVRWHEQRVETTAEMHRDDLELAMHDQMQGLIAAAPDRIHLVHWTISGEGSLTRRATAESLATELTAALRKDYGHRPTPAWTTAVRIEPAAPPAHWLEQDTLLGEFLRSARQHQSPGAEPLELAPYIPARLRDEPQWRGVFDGGSPSRSALVAEAAALGAALLKPDDSHEGRAALLAGSKESAT